MQNNSIRELRRAAGTQLLNDGDVEHFDLASCEVDLLLADVLGCTREQLIAWGEQDISSSQIVAFKQGLEKRLSGEPLAYILGTQEFYSYEFKVTPAVLIPRKETELLVDKVFECLEEAGENLVVDVGAGSGAIILSLANELRKRKPTIFKASQFLAVDLSYCAAQVVLDNARRFGLENNVGITAADLISVLKAPKIRTILVSNPPYVPESEQLPKSVEEFEPQLALRAGPEGLDVLARLIVQVKPLLEARSDNVLFMELGIEQDAAVRGIAGELDLSIEFFKDLQGINRVVRLSIS